MRLFLVYFVYVGKLKKLKFLDIPKNYIDSHIQAGIDHIQAGIDMSSKAQFAIINGALSDLGNLLSGRKTNSINSISVIIPTKNRFNLLLKALKSCSWQTRIPSEVIIVNDGNVFSEKEKAEIIAVLGENCPVEVLINQHRGASGARKTGAQFATSEILTYLDDDNLMWPTWLESVDREFKLGSDQLIYGAQLHKEFDNRILAQTRYSHERLCESNFIDTSSIAHLRNLGQWDDELNIIEGDWDFVLSIASKKDANVRYIPEISSIYFTDAENRISETTQSGKDILMKKYKTFFELNSR